MIDENISALRVEIRSFNAAVSRLDTAVSGLNATMSGLNSAVSDISREISRADRQLDSLNWRIKGFWTDFWSWALVFVPPALILFEIIRKHG
jgi:hypothetical protein